MNKLAIITLFSFLLIGSAVKEIERTTFFPKVEELPKSIPVKENIWVFIMAGQSNMAGKGQVESKDTIPHPRILTINKAGNLIVAKEPLHFYEPTRTGLDCGLSFGKELLKNIPDSISILLIPTAVGGSSVSQWINDSTYRNVTLFSNFKEKVEIGKKYGTVYAIIWHQGETDAASVNTIRVYDHQLEILFAKFREETANPRLPILIGGLGSFAKNDESWQEINRKIKDYLKTDSNSYLISSADLKHKGDSIHFDSEGQRILGQRFANEFIRQKR
jgi:hypothetical protein